MGASHQCRKPHRLNSNQGLYIPRKIIQVFSLHLNCFQRCCLQQSQVDNCAQQSQVQTVTRRNTNSTTQKKVVLQCLSHVVDDDNGGVGQGQRIENVSKGSDICGQQRWVLRRDGGPQELMTTTELLAEKYEPEVLTMTTEASIVEGEYTASLSERLRRVNVYDNRGAGLFTGKSRSQEQQRRRQLRKQKIQHV